MTRCYLCYGSNLAGLTMTFSQRQVWQLKAQWERLGCILCSLPDSLQPAEASWQVLPMSSQHFLFPHPLTWLLADSVYSFLLVTDEALLTQEGLRMSTPHQSLYSAFRGATSKHLFSSVPWAPQQDLPVHHPQVPTVITSKYHTLHWLSSLSDFCTPLLMSARASSQINLW